MISSIQAGLSRLWSAFTGSSAVKSTITTIENGFSKYTFDGETYE